MSERKTKEYQKLVSEGLRPLLEVETEWRPMKNQSGLYSPRIDIAVGPFVYDNNCIPEEHDRMIKMMEKPITSMLKYHNDNIKRGPIWETFEVTFNELCYNNKNARCLFAIEIVTCPHKGYHSLS